jgi:predicted nucleotidyltransferase
MLLKFSDFDLSNGVNSTDFVPTDRKPKSMDAQKAFREVVVVLTPQAAVRPKRSLEPESDVITTPLSVMNS